MNKYLCITIRFIQPFAVFHGRRDAEEPEWPPSPMRVFQALINAASLRVLGRPLAPELRTALHALEVLRPEIIAPRATISTVGYRAYVPHNQFDLVFAALHRGMDPSTEPFRKLNGSVRVEKDYRPMRIESSGDDPPAIHYLYPLKATTLDPADLLRVICPSVRAITHVGWGIDQVVADATLIDRPSSQLKGERWLPSARSGRRLRVHRDGSLAALSNRYGKFLNRLRSDWTPVPPLTHDDVDQVRYRRDTDPLPRPHAVFKLVDENDDAWRYPHAKLVHIAGMARHVAIQTMTRNPPPWIEDAEEWVNRVVRGKRDESAGGEHKQFSYIPLPSIGHAHADALIRNVMIVAPLGLEREFHHVTELLDGQVLEPKGEALKCEADSKPSVSQRIELQKFTPPRGKFIDVCYLGTSREWHTVTPVILDGHNRKSKNEKPEIVAERTVELINAALQRGAIETPCKFTWQAVPFLRNCLSAHKYDRDGRHTGYHRPAHLQSMTAVHLRLAFDQPVAGPITLGAGRHCGLGLFACVRD